MKYLITGGAGFIGVHVVQAFLRQRHSVVVFDNFTSGDRANLKHISRKIKIVTGDVRNPSSLKQACRGCDAIVHLAAFTSVMESIQFPQKCMDINVRGTYQVFHVARQMKLKRVIWASSCAVYGNAQQPPLLENGKTSPQSPYAVSKLMCEALAESFYRVHRLKHIGLRFFNVYGPGQRADSDYAAVIPKFVECYRSNKNLQIYGDGLQTRDFIHVDDVARAIVRAATISWNKIHQRRIFNIGSGISISILDLLAMLEHVAKKHFHHQFFPMRKEEVRFSSADVTLAKNILGFQSSIRLEDGLSSLLKPKNNERKSTHFVD